MKRSHHPVVVALVVLFGLATYAGQAGCSDDVAPVASKKVTAFGNISPQGGTITSVQPTTGGGLTGGSTSGPAFLGLLTSCSTNQVLAWSGTAWACATPSGGITATSPTTGDLTIFGSSTSVANFAGKSCSGTGYATAIGVDGTLTCSLAGVLSGLTSGDLLVATGGNSAGNFGGNTCSGGTFATAISATGALTCSAAGGGISGLTTGTIPVAASSSTLGNGSLLDDGTSVTIAGEKHATCTSTAIGTGGIVTLTIPAGCSMLTWTPTANVFLVGVTHPTTGSRHVSIFVSSSGGGNFSIYPLNTNAASADQFEGDLAGSTGAYLSINSGFTIDYDTVNSKWFANVTADVGALNINGAASIQGILTAASDIVMSQSPDSFFLSQSTLSSGTANLNLDSSGTGVVRINSGTGSVTNSGTGGVIVYSGGATPAVAITLNGNGTLTAQAGQAQLGGQSIQSLATGTMGTTQVDWSPTGWTSGKYAKMEVGLSANSSLSGVVPISGAGDLMTICNPSTSYDLQLLNDVTSTAANRFYNAQYGIITLLHTSAPYEQCATYIYGSAVARWVLLSTTATSTGQSLILGSISATGGISSASSGLTSGAGVSASLNVTSGTVVTAGTHLTSAVNGPAVTVCGTLTASGNDNAFFFSATSTATCTVTFHTAWANAPACIAETSAGAVVAIPTISTTTLSFAATSGTVYRVLCGGL